MTIERKAADLNSESKTGKRIRSVSEINLQLVNEYRQDKIKGKLAIESMILNHQMYGKTWLFSSRSENERNFYCDGLTSVAKGMVAQDLSSGILSFVKENKNVCMDLEDLEVENDPHWRRLSPIFSDNDHEELREAFFVGRRMGYEAVLDQITPRQGFPLFFYPRGFLERMGVRPYYDDGEVSRFFLPTAIDGMSVNASFSNGDHTSALKIFISKL